MGQIEKVLSKVKGNIKFAGEDQKEFFKVLRNRVDNYFIENNISKHANAQMIFKSILLLTLFLGPLVVMSLVNMPVGLQMVGWFIMGLALAGIGMSVMHDANHGAYSNNDTVNKLMGYSLVLLGGSIFNWKLQHNILHHTYTNISKYDEDIDDKLILRMSPHTKSKGIQQYQVFYAFLFYGILTLYWATAKDFLQFRRYVKNGVSPLSKSEARGMLFRITLTKIFYFAYLVFIPIFVFNVSWPIWIAGFLLMHFVAGLVLTVIFQLAHTVEGTSHPVPTENGTIENSWAVHQLETTVNFATHNKLLSYYVGGLNFQVEHHLFPKICHVHYPNLAPIVRQTAKEFGITYMENKYFSDAFMSHVRTLKRFGVATVEFG